MKQPLLLSLCFLMLFGCKKSDLLSFEPKTYTGEACADCPQINISLPQALDKNKVAATINNALKEEVIFLLSFDDGSEATDVTEAIKSFGGGYSELKEIYPEETTAWDAKIDAAVTFENKYVITLEMDSYIFTGGAHGYSSKRYLNFDKLAGTELENWQLFKDTLEFQQFAEDKFRAQEKIPLGKSINSTGFMFEDESFYLPENIGFNKQGLILLYNQYEVASYADGPIVLMIPYNDVKKYLKTKIEIAP